MIYHV